MKIRVDNISLLHQKTVIVEHVLFLHISVYSLYNNSIGDEGAEAISVAMKTLTNLQGLV